MNLLRNYAKRLLPQVVESMNPPNSSQVQTLVWKTYSHNSQIRKFLEKDVEISTTVDTVSKSKMIMPSLIKFAKFFHMFTPGGRKAERDLQSYGVSDSDLELFQNWNSSAELKTGVAAVYCKILDFLYGVEHIDILALKSMCSNEAEKILVSLRDDMASENTYDNPAFDDSKFEIEDSFILLDHVEGPALLSMLFNKTPDFNPAPEEMIKTSPLVFTINCFCTVRNRPGFLRHDKMKLETSFNIREGLTSEFRISGWETVLPKHFATASEAFNSVFEQKDTENLNS